MGAGGLGSASAFVAGASSAGGDVGAGRRCNLWRRLRRRGRWRLGVRCCRLGRRLTGDDGRRLGEARWRRLGRDEDAVDPQHRRMAEGHLHHRRRCHGETLGALAPQFATVDRPLVRPGLLGARVIRCQAPPGAHAQEQASVEQPGPSAALVGGGHNRDPGHAPAVAVHIEAVHGPAPAHVRIDRRAGLVLALLALADDAVALLRSRGEHRLSAGHGAGIRHYQQLVGAGGGRKQDWQQSSGKRNDGRTWSEQAHPSSPPHAICPKSACPGIHCLPPTILVKVRLSLKGTQPLRPLYLSAADKRLIRFAACLGRPFAPQADVRGRRLPMQGFGEAVRQHLGSFVARAVSAR